MIHQRVFEPEARERVEESKSTFRIAVAYDSRDAAIRAMYVIGEIIRQFAGEFEFGCDLWRFDVLDLPKTREVAVRAGATADLLIIAARCDTGLSASVKEWLDRCIAKKAPGSAGLVALLESRRPTDDSGCVTRQFLQNAADRSLLDFFLHEVRVPESGLALTPETLQERAKPVTSALEGILCQPAPTPRSARRRSNR